MKIAYIVPSLANKGPILVVKDLVEVMIENGHSCIVFYFDELVELKFKCPTVKIGLFKRIDFENYDVIHSHCLRPDLYVWLHKIYTNFYSISTIHSFISDDLRAQYNKFIACSVMNIWMRLLKKQNKIIVLSKIAKLYYSKWILIDKIETIYNTRILDNENKLSSEELEQLQDFKSDSLLIGINARLSPTKGIDLLIKAMPLLKQMKLWIIGDGQIITELRNLSCELNVNDRVRFVGYKKDAFRYLPYYDVYAMSSRGGEGFPLALLEAASYSVPTVCSDIPIFKEFFSKDEVAFFESDNVPSLVEAIQCAKGNVKMAENLHKRYLACYSESQFYKNHLSIYMNK